MNTDFYGKFGFDHPLTAEHQAILAEFAEEEHDRAGSDGKPPATYCQWIPTEDGSGLEWDGAEKFYYYGEWLEYLIAHFLKPWGYTLNGTVQYDGWTEGVTGAISVMDNAVVVTREEVDPGKVEAWWDTRVWTKKS
jgi:hypothetical protein